MESASYRRPYWLEQFFSWIRGAFLNYRVPFLTAVIAGFFAHGFAFTNKLVSFDEVGSLFDKGTTASSGRWGLDLLSCIFPDFSIPWFYGILSIVLMAVSVCIVVRIFNLRSKLLQALIAGSILVFPSLSATVIYLYTLSSYAVSFLLAVLAVWLLQKKTWKATLLSLAAMIFSLGIYQAYISIAASFLVLLLIQELLYDGFFLTLVKRGLYYLAFLVISLLGYLLVTKLFYLFSGEILGEYANQRINFSLSYLPTGLLEAYRAFFKFFANNMWGLIPLPASQVVHGLCILAALALLILWLLQKKRPLPELLLLGVLLLLLPLSINCLYLFISADPALCAIHTLVLYGFITVYVFAAVVAEACDSPAFFEGMRSKVIQCAQNVLLLGLLASIFINSYVANSLYMSLYLRYENAYGFYASMLADLHQQPDYDEDTQIALIGSYEESGFYWGELEYLYNIMGSDGFQPDSHSNWFFLYYYMGLRLPFASRDEVQQIQATEEFSNMPVYPYHGYMQKFGDTMVIKLSP